MLIAGEELTTPTVEPPFTSRRSLIGALQLATDLAASRDLADLQRRYIAGVRDLIGADTWGVYLLDEDGRPISVTQHAAPAGFLHDYEQAGRADDPLLAYLGRQAAPVHERILFSARGWHRAALSDVMRAWQLEHSMQGPVTIGDTLVGTLNFARALGTRPFSEVDLRVVAWLCVQVAGAYQRVTSREALALRSNLRRACMETINVPVVVTDARGRVVEANRAGRAYLAPLDRTRLAPPLARAAAVNVARLQDGPDRIARALAEPEGSSALGHRVLTRRIGGADAHYASTFVAVAGSGAAAVDTGGQALSPRERQVVELVAHGLTNGQIAQRLGVSTNTVKDHLKRVHRKLGASTRTELAVWAERHLGVDA